MDENKYICLLYYAKFDNRKTYYRSWMRLLLGARCCAQWCCTGSVLCSVLRCGVTRTRTGHIERTAQTPGGLDREAKWINSFSKDLAETNRPQTAPVLV